MRKPWRTIYALIVSLFLVSPGAAQEAKAEKKPPKIAVMDLTPLRDVDPGVTQALTELTMARVQAMGKGECIGPSDIRALLNLEQEKQLLNCEEDASCVAEVGGALGVSRLLSGSVSPIGSQYLVALKLFDVQQAKVLSRVVKQVPKDEDKLLAAFPDIVLELFGPVSVSPVGQFDPGAAVDQERAATLIVRSEPSGSEVMLSGRVVGTTPLKLPGVAPGSYNIQITHRDYSTYLGKVTLSPQEETIREVKLELDRKLAERNHQFALEKHEDEVLWQVIWGLGHAVGGGCVTLFGGAVLLGGLSGGSSPGVMGGGLALLGGIVWTGYGIYRLLSLPPPPVPEWEQAAEP